MPKDGLNGRKILVRPKKKKPANSGGKLQNIPFDPLSPLALTKAANCIDILGLANCAFSTRLKVRLYGKQQ
jgi:hypothetical protein